jgi:hypothetical protein
MKIQKYKLWLLFFFIIFGFTFAMIIWTVKSAVNTPVYEDKSFLSSYHIVDSDYNKMVGENRNFLANYDITFSINGHEVGLEISDIFLGQRSIKKSSTHQNILKVGKNELKISLTDRGNSQAVSDAKIELLLTRPIQDSEDLNLSSFKYSNGEYRTNFQIGKRGNWNLIGKVTTHGNKGYFFIKTNTK